MAQEDAKSKASVVWEQLKCKDSVIKSKAEAILQRSYGRSQSEEKKASPKKKSPPEWMVSLGMTGKRNAPKISTEALKEEKPASDVDKEEVRKAAAAALSAVKLGGTVKKDAPVAPAVLAEEETSTKLAEEGSGSEKRPASGIDGILEQIQKKQKINVLDKSKQDWGEFKDEKGFQEELEAYKKSGDKYLERVAFLQRADLREYEKERDARLAHQARRKQNVDYQED